MSDTGPTIPGPYVSPGKTESSPLTKSFISSTTKTFESWLWGWDFSVDGAGSLKTIIVILFGFTGVITLILFTELYNGETQIVPHGAVSSDSAVCSQIGGDILAKGGHAVDAAVGVAMCLGVVNFHITGLGGGGFLLGYNHVKQEVFDVINFLPSPPSDFTVKNITTQGDSVGVPGFLAGLWTAHQHSGRLPWADLVLPSVSLARNGFTVSNSLASAAACVDKQFESDDLKNVLLGLVPGQNTSLPRLAATLELIASKGAAVFYNGSLADKVVYSVKLGHGSMGLVDLAGYKPILSASQKRRFLNYDVIVPASSFGGDLLVDALESIEGLELRSNEGLTADTVRKLSDLLYDTYTILLQKTQRSPLSLKPAASVVTVIDDDDNYVSLVTGLNSWLGSQLLTESGFLLNNALLNNANGELTPISLATPVVLVDSGNICGLRAVSGAADSRDMVQVLTELLLFGENVNSSIEAPRFQLGSAPRSIVVEDSHDPKFNAITLDALKSMQVAVGVQPDCSAGDALHLPYNSINMISKKKDLLQAYSDSRGFGESLQF